jgi:hypothetical protein
VRWRCRLLLVLLLASPAWALEEWETVNLQDGAVADGNGTEFRVTRHATVAVDLSVSGTATVTWEVRSDPSGTYQALRCQNSTSGTIATTATASGNYVCPVPAQGNFRARISDCSSCAVTAIGKMSTAAFGPLVAGAGGGTGDASLAEQETQTAHLAAIETAVEGTLDVSCSSGCSGGTQYDQGTAGTATDKLTMAGAIRRDTAALDAGVADGDRAGLSTDSAGRLRVTAADTTQPVSGTVTANAGTGDFTVVQSTGSNLHIVCDSGCAGSGGTSAADDADFTAGTTDGTPAMGVYESTPSSVTDGDLGVVGITQERRLKTSATIDAALPAGANNIGTVTVTDGSGALNVIVDSSALPSGAATSAKQDTVIGHVDGIEGLLTTIDADTGNIATSTSSTATNTSNTASGVGATGDAAATAGSTGSLSAKLRLMTSQLDSIKTAVELIDNNETGASVHYRTSAGSTEDEHEVKGSAGRLFSITATNTNAAARYLRCANQVIGSTTPGTTTVFLGLAIPGATAGAGFTTNFGPAGIAFSTGLTCWLVTGAADSDVAEVAANEIKVIYTYK